MIGLDSALILLRILVYVGSIAAAGGILFALSFPRAANEIRDIIERQIDFGCGLLLLTEPVRYVTFQLAVSGGDWSLAFGPDLRWMGMQTPMGQAAGARLIAALSLLTLGLRSAALNLSAALVMIGSFLLEGHTASSEARSALSTTALLVHLAAVHWWLGALYPLLALTRRSDQATLVSAVETFSRRAVWIVAGLMAAGALVLGLLTGWSLRIESAYQQRFLLKLGLVALLLAIAAWNKLRLTPLLRREEEAGAAKLTVSIRVEIVTGLLILAATTWAISTAPDE